MKQAYLLLVLFLMAQGVAQARSREEITAEPSFEEIEQMLQFAAKYQGKPYRNGAEGPNAFDCSGFTRFCYKRLGITLNRSSKDQTKQGKKVRLRRNLEEGDLVFFKGSKGWGVGHVGIVYRKRGGKKFDFIHASTSRGVVIEDSETEYFKKRYKKARRITSDRDLRKAIKRFAKAEKEERRAMSETRKAEQKPVVTEPIQPKQQKASGQRTHVVSKGDTLYNISKRYGCTVEDIKRWNGLKNNDISLGQPLVVGAD